MNGQVVELYNGYELSKIQLPSNKSQLFRLILVTTSWAFASNKQKLTNITTKIGVIFRQWPNLSTTLAIEKNKMEKYIWMLIFGSIYNEKVLFESYWMIFSHKIKNNYL